MEYRSLNDFANSKKFHFVDFLCTESCTQHLSVVECSQMLQTYCSLALVKQIGVMNK